MDLAEKLEILADSAKYDVACTVALTARGGMAAWAAARRRASATPLRQTGAAFPC